MSGTIVGTVTGASDRGACARIFRVNFSDMIILKIWLLGSLSYPIIDLRNRRSHARRGYYLRGSLIIMQDDATPTDTTPSQKRLKRETPEDAGTAQEPERRVRPRETPVGEGAAAARRFASAAPGESTGAFGLSSSRSSRASSRDLFGNRQ